MSVRERSIIMRAESVRAILAGRKTQTRRVVTTRIPAHRPEVFAWFAPRITENKALEGLWCRDESGTPEFLARCPYGAPGDRLWVRESFRFACAHSDDDTLCIAYRASQDGLNIGLIVNNIPRPSGITAPPHSREWLSPLHMPRWASRLTLEITDVRVQRLQEISEQDAEAEGIVRVDDIGDGNTAPAYAGTDGSFTNGWSAQSAFARVWDALNAKRGFPWASNPWVWAVTFKRVEVAHVST